MLEDPSVGGTWIRRLAKAAFAACSTLLGFLGGAFVGSRLLVQPGGMGWDRIADALGGMMVGTLVGLVAGCALAVKLEARGLKIGLLIVVLMTALVVLLLRFIPPPPLDTQGALPEALAVLAEAGRE